MSNKSGYLLRNCNECGKAFRTNRIHARFCSGKCRQKNYRKSIKRKVGEGNIQVENVTSVTLSYLEFLLSEHPQQNAWVEDWQN